METNKLAKTGAVFFVIWGVIHVLGGGMILLAALSDSPAESLAMMGSTVTQAELATVPGGIVNAVVQFHGFNILWMGILSIFIAVKLNWKNSKIGFWINTRIVGFADLGLITFLILPGYMAWSDGFIGPILLISALIFSS